MNKKKKFGRRSSGNVNRNLDNMGRLVIPKEMRESLGLKNGDEVKIKVVNDEIIVTNPKKESFKEWLEAMIKTNDSVSLDIVLEKYNEMG